MLLKVVLGALIGLLCPSLALACSCMAPQDIPPAEQEEAIARAAIGAALIGRFEVLAEPGGATGSGGRLKPLRLALGKSSGDVRIAPAGRLWTSATCDSDLPRGRRLWLILYRAERRWAQDQPIAKRLLAAERRRDVAEIGRIRAEVAGLHRTNLRTIGRSACATSISLRPNT